MADKITQTIEVVADTTEASKEIGKLQDKANRLSSSLESIRIGRKGDAGVLVNALDRSVKQSSRKQIEKQAYNSRRSTALTTVPFSRLSEEDKIRSVVQDLSKVKQGIAPDPELRKRTLSLATSMLRKGRATTGLGLKSSFEFYAPKGKLAKPADELLRSVLSEANASYAEEKSFSKALASASIRAQRDADRAAAREEREEQSLHIAYRRRMHKDDIKVEKEEDKRRANEERRRLEEADRRQKEYDAGIQDRFVWQDLWDKAEKKFNALEKQKAKKAEAARQIKELPGLFAEGGFIKSYLSAEKLANTEDKIDSYKERYNVLQRYKGRYGETDKYRANFKTLTKDVRSISKSTNGQYKDLESLKKTLERSPINAAGGIGALGKVAGKIFAPLALLDVMKKVIGFAYSGYKEAAALGDDYITKHSMYGNDIDLPLAGAIAAGYKGDENTAFIPQAYAADFRQRMMYEGIPDNEIISLSRMGEYGRMVMSDEAKKNPRLADEKLMGWIRTHDEATVRSAIGMNPKLAPALPLLMKRANTVIRTPEEEAELYEDIQTKQMIDTSAGLKDIRLKAAEFSKYRKLKEQFGNGLANSLFRDLDSRGMDLVASQMERYGYSTGEVYRSTGTLGAKAKEEAMQELNRMMNSNGVTQNIASGAVTVTNNITNYVKDAQEAGNVSNAIIYGQTNQSYLNSLSTKAN